MSSQIVRLLYGSNNYRPVSPKQQLYKHGVIKYCGQMPINVNDILCIREIPDSYINPKCLITLAMKNPDDSTLITEYEFSGSAKQWLDACYEAQTNGGAEIDFFA